MEPRYPWHRRRRRALPYRWEDRELYDAAYGPPPPPVRRPPQGEWDDPTFYIGTIRIRWAERQTAAIEALAQAETDREQRRREREEGRAAAAQAEARRRKDEAAIVALRAATKKAQQNTTAAPPQNTTAAPPVRAVDRHATAVSSALRTLGPATAGELAVVTRLNPSAVADALRHLRSADLVDQGRLPESTGRRGRRPNVYRLTTPTHDAAWQRVLAQANQQPPRRELPVHRPRTDDADVLAALRSGPATIAELAITTGFTRHRVADTLRGLHDSEMVRRGRLAIVSRQPGPGPYVYRLATAEANHAWARIVDAAGKQTPPRPRVDPPSPRPLFPRDIAVLAVLDEFLTAAEAADRSGQPMPVAQLVLDGLVARGLAARTGARPFRYVRVGPVPEAPPVSPPPVPPEPPPPEPPRPVPAQQAEVERLAGLWRRVEPPAQAEEPPARRPGRSPRRKVTQADRDAAVRRGEAGRRVISRPARAVLDVITDRPASRTEVGAAADLSYERVGRILDGLVADGRVVVEHRGRTAFYRRPFTVRDVQGNGTGPTRRAPPASATDDTGPVDGPSGGTNVG